MLQPTATAHIQYNRAHRVPAQSRTGHKHESTKTVAQDAAEAFWYFEESTASGQLLLASYQVSEGRRSLCF